MLDVQQEFLQASSWLCRTFSIPISIVVRHFTYSKKESANEAVHYSRLPLRATSAEEPSRHNRLCHSVVSGNTVSRPLSRRPTFNYGWDILEGCLGQVNWIEVDHDCCLSFFARSFHDLSTLIASGGTSLRGQTVS
jgi:hypothetical protein